MTPFLPTRKCIIRVQSACDGSFGFWQIKSIPILLSTQNPCKSNVIV